MKNGNSVSVTYVFKLGDESRVDVLIEEPTTDKRTVGKKSVFENEYIERGYELRKRIQFIKKRSKPWKQNMM